MIHFDCLPKQPQNHLRPPLYRFPTKMLQKIGTVEFSPEKNSKFAVVQTNFSVSPVHDYDTRVGD